MTMSNCGLSKLVEECGEVLQAVGKLLAYPGGIHPDGAGNLYARLEDEMADHLAVCRFVREKLDLDSDRVIERTEKKYSTFCQWDADVSA